MMVSVCELILMFSFWVKYAPFFATFQRNVHSFFFLRSDLFGSRVPRGSPQLLFGGQSRRMAAGVMEAPSTRPASVNHRLLWFLSP